MPYWHRDLRHLALLARELTGLGHDVRLMPIYDLKADIKLTQGRRKAKKAGAP